MIISTCPPPRLKIKFGKLAGAHLHLKNFRAAAAAADAATLHGAPASAALALVRVQTSHFVKTRPHRSQVGLSPHPAATVRVKSLRFTAWSNTLWLPCGYEPELWDSYLC